MQDLYAAINTVKDPSFIRVESDEVTYPMHIIIRYEVERDMLAGDLAVDDVPRAWNDKMQQYLGCTPKDDKEARARSLL
jgi:carboxypeptidase Taq